MPKREKLPRIDEHITESVTIETGDTAMGIGPATCSAITTNASTALSHTHEIDASSSPSIGAAYLLEVDSNGDLTIPDILTVYDVKAEILEASSYADVEGLITGTVTPNSTGGTLLVKGYVQYRNGLQAAPAAGGTYTVYPMVYLATPLTSTAWDGDGKTSANNGTIDLSSVFSAPAGIKAVLVSAYLTDVGGGGAVINMGPSMTYKDCLIVETDSVSATGHECNVVPCNGDGDVYAAFAGTAEVILRIYGYAL